jgi:hypothetical protein
MMAVEVSPSPAAFAEEVRRDAQAWGDFLRSANIKVE